MIFHRQADLEEFDGLFAYSGTVKDGGVFIHRLWKVKFPFVDLIFQSNEWIEKMTSTSETGGAQEYAIPNSITIDGDHGDYYITANIASLSNDLEIKRKTMDFVGNLYQSDSDATKQFFGCCFQL